MFGWGVKALAGLQRAGLVEVRDDPTHGRAKIALVTRAGADGLRDGLRAALAVQECWTAAIGEKKMQQLLKLLEAADAEEGVQIFIGA